jgi:hypothetical protein
MRIGVWVVAAAGMTTAAMAQSAVQQAPQSRLLAQMTESIPQQAPAHGSAGQGGATAATTLTVAGHNGEAQTLHRNGKWYVEVEGLARMTGGSLQFQTSRIVLTLPSPQAAPEQVASQTPQRPPEEKGFTREFLRAGVEQMSVIREWRSALENAIRTNNPVEESWISYYRRMATDKMGLATATATSESDRKAIGLLQSEMAMMGQLSDRFLALRSNLSYVDPTSLDNDPLDQKILSCAQGMAALAVPGGMFEDVSACH